MITSNNRKMPEAEQKRLAILTTNKIRERMRHESRVIVPATKIGGVILQAGKQYERPAAKIQTPVVFDHRKKIAPVASAPIPEDLEKTIYPRKRKKAAPEIVEIKGKKASGKVRPSLDKVAFITETKKTKGGRKKKT